MRNYLSLALEEANIETVNTLVSNFNTEHSDDGVQIHLVNAESALADIVAIHSGYSALQALDTTTANMGDNVSVESMDVIKQYIGFINASTGFKISLESEDNSKGILARIWEAIKRFFAGIWNFISGLFSKSKKTEEKIIVTEKIIENKIAALEDKPPVHLDVPAETIEQHIETHDGHNSAVEPKYKHGGRKKKKILSYQIKINSNSLIFKEAKDIPTLIKRTHGLIKACSRINSLIEKKANEMLSADILKEDITFTKTAIETIVKKVVDNSDDIDTVIKYYREGCNKLKEGVVNVNNSVSDLSKEMYDIFKAEVGVSQFRLHNQTSIIFTDDKDTFTPVFTHLNKEKMFELHSGINSLRNPVMNITSELTKTSSKFSTYTKTIESDKKIIDGLYDLVEKHKDDLKGPANRACGHILNNYNSMLELKNHVWVKVFQQPYFSINKAQNVISGLTDAFNHGCQPVYEEVNSYM